ncbi:DUF2235 domain-containing protein [Oerskovia enterophila]
MKRLVLCCDGTWNSPVRASVSNIEKIARSVHTGIGPDGVQQMVFSVEGVGARGYRVDALLGGAFGYGLSRNVVAGYRDLALNYEPDDEIYVFGFSRGAYTARSVAGMIASVGLLTADALADRRAGNLLAEAEALYRDRTPARKAKASRFREQHCYPQVPLTFLGVFDTVGALGVPGITRRRSRFHDVRLSGAVQCARQALAIDERRLTFEPCLWDVPADDDRPGGVKQVWFPGGHSDVGGGTSSPGLSDVALLWMMGEAAACGLTFHPDRVLAQLGDDPELVCRFTPGPVYRVLNVVKRWRHRPRFRGTRRLLAGVPLDDGYVDDVLLSDLALSLTADPTSVYGEHAVNVAWWKEAAGTGLAVEPVQLLSDRPRPLVLA